MPVVQHLEGSENRSDRDHDHPRSQALHALVKLAFADGGDDEQPETIKLHAIQDPLDNSATAPFFSRAGAWAYRVEWYSTEDANECYECMRRLGEETKDVSLLEILHKINLPLLRVLVARNARLVKGADVDIRLDPALEALLMAPTSALDIKTKSKAPINKHWMMTHLLTILQDRLQAALFQSLVANVMLHPPEVDAITRASCAAPFPLGVNPFQLKKTDPLRRTHEWMEDTQTNWIEAVRDFIRKYKKYRALSRTKANTEADASTADEITPLKKLFVQTTHLEGLGDVSTPLLNLHEAALALASLQLYDDNGGETRWHDLLQENTGLQLQNTYQNLPFLRSVLAAAVLGPVALLCNCSLRPSNNESLTMTQLVQMSMLHSQGEGIERVIIGKEIWLLLVDMAVKGPQIVFDRLDLLIPAWSKLLDPDDAVADSHNFAPKQEDSVAPFSSAQLPVPCVRAKEDPNDGTFTAMNASSRKATASEKMAKAREQVTSVMKKSYKTSDIREFVELVEIRLLKVINESTTKRSATPAPPESKVGIRISNPKRKRCVDEDVVIRPEAKRVRTNVQPGFLDSHIRQEIKFVSSHKPMALTLPKWIPHKNDCRFSAHKLYIEAFVPEVSWRDDEAIGYSDEKVLMKFEWPVTKTRDMASLATMINSSQKRFSMSKFIQGKEDPVIVNTHYKWNSFSMSERADLFKTANIHVRHDPNAYDPHPSAICGDISAWDESQLANYFDLDACVEAEDQTWVPQSFHEEGRVLSPKEYAMNIPRRKLAKHLLRNGKSIPIPCAPLEYPEIDNWVDTFPEALTELNADVDIPVLHLEEEDTDARDRCSSIDQFLYTLRRDEQLQEKGESTRAGVLFLKHVPIPVQLPLSGLDSFGRLGLRHDAHCAITTSTSSTTAPCTFAQFMSSTAMIRTQVAPNGLAKRMRVVLGEVAVFTAAPDCESADLFCTDTVREEDFARHLAGLSEPYDLSELKWAQEVRVKGGESCRPTFSVRSGFQEASMDWHFSLLRPGDDFYIRPNTPYSVVALKPSLILCSLFYSAPNLDRTLIALITQHYYGHLLVRDNRLSIATSWQGALFLKMLSYQRQALKRSNSSERGDALSDKELASLICIIGHLSELDPSLGMEDTHLAGTGNGPDDCFGILRRPKPRATQPEAMYTGRGIAYQEDGAMVVDVDNKPQIWQFSPEFHSSITHAISTELPLFMDVLLQTDRCGDVLAHLTTTTKAFNKWRRHLESASTIRERDREIKDCPAFESVIQDTKRKWEARSREKSSA